MSKNDITILYVEDEVHVREMLSRFLQRFCTKIYIAKDGEEGLSLYKKHHPDIVISDIRMPKMSGLEMVEAIKKINPSQLIMLITAHNDSEFLHKAINLGIDGYILKPVDLDAVNEKLETLIQRIQNERAAQQLKKSEEKLKLLSQAVEQMHEMVQITDVDGKIIYVNPAATENTQYEESELIGKSNRILKSGEHSKKFYDNLWKTVLDGKTYQNTLINKRKDGSLYYDEKIISPIKDKNGKVRYFVSTSRDITQRVALEKELQKLATKDALTGLYNRYKMSTLIEDEIKRTKRYGEVFSLLMLDIDKFKHVNDTYGHDVGDYVLQELSRIVLQTIRKTDSFGRWGGEEFMLLAPHTNAEQAMELAQKIRKRVEEHSFEHVEKITVSIGVTEYINTEKETSLLKRVDQALYEAKANGRNQVVCF
ncbi:diguanylate cyclase [Sulfurimonas sediminis]|uniref:Diguanylate cyclase n=1 Tax=Sulfurimonas sediminis TaxID=2590020 RepID=A0A7M1B2Z6_9BACT|nr:diguanylate cyclase [Sulfurimonas sediminis]QOP43078.1 diguanylate cyclase [Sulfurimonas sediminis]